LEGWKINSKVYAESILRGHLKKYPPDNESRPAMSSADKIKLGSEMYGSPRAIFQGEEPPVKV
jgi:hypothetical protein